MTIYVIGVRGISPDATPDNFFYVDEKVKGWQGSPLANQIPIITPALKPHAMGQYKAWLHAQIIERDNEQCAELQRIAEAAKTGSVILGAWDSEADGHAHIVKRAVEWMLTQEKVTA